MMRPDSVAVTGITFYPNWYRGSLRSIGDADKVRGDLALDSIAAGIRNGYRMVVADGASSSAFKDELSQLAGLTLVERRGMERAEGRRQGYVVASGINGVEAIIKTELEKLQVVQRDIPELVSPIIRQDAVIVVGKRNPTLHQQTYPEYQWESEVEANARFNELLHQTGLLHQGESLDMFFGPVAFANRPDILGLFLEKYQFTLPSDSGIRKYVNPEDWSDGYFFSIVKALHQGLNVQSVEVDFHYPDLQRRNEETSDKGAVD